VAWHAFPNPENFQLREVMRPYDAHGRTVLYAETPNQPERARRAVTWLRENPERIHLARIGLQFADRDGRPVDMADLSDIRQELDLWSGLISSEFRVGDSLVRVQTVCHPSATCSPFESLRPCFGNENSPLRSLFRMPQRRGQGL